MLISGKAHSGKSTTKDFLIEKLSKIDGIRLFPYSFADPLKYMAKAFGGWNGEKDELGREFLQGIGKVFRKYDKDIFCKHLINQMDKSNNVFPPHFVLVDDWRFLNEAEFFTKNPIFDVIKIRIFGRGGLDGQLADDESEVELPEVNYEVYENGLNYGIYNITVDNKPEVSLETLSSKLDIALKVISENYIVE